MEETDDLSQLSRVVEALLVDTRLLQADVIRQRDHVQAQRTTCLLYTSPSPRDRTRSRMPSSA